MLTTDLASLDPYTQTVHSESGSCPNFSLAITRYLHQRCALVCAYRGTAGSENAAKLSHPATRLHVSHRSLDERLGL